MTKSQMVAELERLILSGCSLSISRKEEKDGSFSIAVVAKDSTITWWARGKNLSVLLEGAIEEAN